MAQRVHVTKLLSPHAGVPFVCPGESMDAGLSRSEMAHQGVMGFALLLLVIVTCEVPRTEVRWAQQHHHHLLGFKSFWGPSSPDTHGCCLFLRWSLNIIVWTGQGVEQWVIRKIVTTCGHPQWPLFRITALVASGKPFIGALGVSPTWPKMILTAALVKSGCGSFYISKETEISYTSS